MRVGFRRAGPPARRPGGDRAPEPVARCRSRPGAAHARRESPCPFAHAATTRSRAFALCYRCRAKQLWLNSIATRLHWDEDESNDDETLSRNCRAARVAPILAARYLPALAREPRAGGGAFWRSRRVCSRAGFSWAPVCGRTSQQRLGVARASGKLGCVNSFRRRHARPLAARVLLDEMLRRAWTLVPGARVEIVHDGTGRLPLPR